MVAVGQLFLSPQVPVLLVPSVLGSADAIDVLETKSYWLVCSKLCSNEGLASRERPGAGNDRLAVLLH